MTETFCGPALCLALGFYWAGLAADVRTTETGLGYPGHEEQNPLLGPHPSDTRLVLQSAAGGALVTWGARRMDRRWPKTTRGLLIGAGLVHFYLAKRNSDLLD